MKLTKIDKKDIELINKFILENYSDEIDPYTRGEN